MSNELEISGNGGLKKSNSNISKSKIGQGLMTGAIASLSSIELPRMFNQLVIFLLDGSGSMTFNGTSGKSKGYEVHQAAINVLQRLKESKNKSSFDVAFWAFANETVEMFPVKSVKDFDLIKDCFNPCEYIKDYTKTYLKEALTHAKDQANDYLNLYKDQNTKVLFIILGDGAINDYAKCFDLKEEISKNSAILFSSILFESPQWAEKFDEEMIEKIKKDFSNLASSKADYMSTVDAEKIRSHMIQSITKVSKIQ